MSNYGLKSKNNSFELESNINMIIDVATNFFYKSNCVKNLIFNNLLVFKLRISINHFSNYYLDKCKRKEDVKTFNVLKKDEFQLK